METLNDADAAGIAEMRYGAGRDRGGVVLMLTFGTGIGSALFVDGRLVPNTEFGHIQVDGEDGERRAAASAREREELTYPEWAARVDRYLDVLEAGLWPDLIIVGGGVSKKAHKWVPLLTTRTPVVPAELQNDAGIVGAALAAARAPGPGEPRNRSAAAPRGSPARSGRTTPVSPPVTVVTMAVTQPAALQPGGIPCTQRGQTRAGRAGTPPGREREPEPLPEGQTAPWRTPPAREGT